MKKEFITLPLDELIPYENNPRINDNAVHDVKLSIKQCENLDPIEIDENNVILSGHTRLIALTELGYTESEVLRISGLTDEQKRKYRILANKTNELAEWDFEKLSFELEELDFSDFDLEFDIQKELKKEQKEEGQVPFAEILNEENNYIILKFDNSIDWLQVETLFGLKPVKAYSTRKDGKIAKNMQRVGVGRVVNGVDFLNKLGEKL